MSADGKYPVQYCGILQLPIQIQLSQKLEYFFNYLFHFWNLHQILSILKTKMMVLANMFPKLQTVKNFVTGLCKKRRFTTGSDSRHVKVSRILAKSP